MIVAVELGSVHPDTVRRLTLTVGTSQDDVDWLTHFAQIIATVHHASAKNKLPVCQPTQAERLALAIIGAPNEKTPIAMLLDECSERFYAEEKGSKYVGREQLIGQLGYCYRLLTRIERINSGAGRTPYHGMKSTLAFTGGMLKKCGVDPRKFDASSIVSQLTDVVEESEVV